MKAATVKKLDGLLNIGIPAAKQENRTIYKSVKYVDPCHIIMVRADINPEGTEMSFVGENEDDVKTDGVMSITAGYPRMHCDRRYLLHVLTNLDSETVSLQLNEDAPIRIEGRVEECDVTAIIAPRIE